MTRSYCIVLTAMVTALTFLANASAEAGRTVLSLDGTWQIAEGSMDRVPGEFKHTVPVPGLVDMARPAFQDVGTESSGKHREAFWYRRTFPTLLPSPLSSVSRFTAHFALTEAAAAKV